MINGFLKRVFGGLTADDRMETPPGKELDLPRIGRKRDLIPVNREIAGVAAGRSGIEATYERLADQVRETLQYDRLAITVVDTEQDTFQTAFVVGSALVSDSLGAYPHSSLRTRSCICSANASASRSARAFTRIEE